MAENRVKITITADGKNAEQAIKRLNKKLHKLEGGTDKSKKGMRDLSGAMGKTSKSASLFGKAMKGALAYLSVRAVVGFEAAVVRTGMQFEQTMKTVGAVSRATEKEQQALTAAARKMGETTEWSASQSAEALRYMAMAGFRVKDSIAALPGVLDLATAGGLELGLASDIVTDSLTAMGLGVSDLSHFSDVLVATTTRANTNIEMMGESLKYAAPIAHAMGYEIEEVSALLGTLANAGIKASDAGTDLRQAMIRNSKAAKELGTDANDLIGTIKAAKKAGWGATEVQERWGMIASKSVLVLMEQVEQFENLYDQLQNVDGATTRLADTMRNTTAGAWKELKSAVESVQLDLFDDQSGELQQALRDLAGEIRANKNNIVSGLSAIGKAAVLAFEGLAGIVKYAGLRSLSETVVEAARLAKEEYLDWKKFMDTTSALERQQMVDEAKKAKEELEKAAATLSKQGFLDHSKFTKAFLAEQKKMLKEARKLQKEYEKESRPYGSDASDPDSYRNFIKALETRKKAEEKAAKELVRIEKKKNKEIKKQRDREEKEQAKRLREQLNASIAAGKKELKERQREYKEKKRLEEEHARVRKNIQADFLKDYTAAFEDEYEMAKKAVHEQARIYRAAGADRVKVKEWENHEINKILEDELRAHKEAERKKILASQDFFAGMKLAYDDLEEHQRTWAQTGYDIMEDFAQQSGDVMGNMLFDAITGDMKDLGDYWESFWGNVLKSMTNYIGQMAAEWATTELISLGSSFASMIFHDGETKLKQDELHATLQEGEMVIPKDQAETIRTAVGHGGKSSKAFFDDVVNHVKVGARHDFTPSSWAEPDIAGMATAQLISSGIAGAGAGYTNYANVMRQGRMLQDAGFDISASKIKEVALDHALAGAVSTMVTGFAGNFIGELGSYGLGVGDYIIDTPGAGKINIGSFINAGIATLAGAGLPGMMLAALSPLTNLAISSIADALDLRANETLRDSLENKYKHIGGRLAYQSAKSFLESYNPAAKIQNLVDEQGDMWAYDPVLGENIIVLKEQINANAAKHLRSRIDRQFGLHGKSIADSIWSHGTAEAKASLAGIVTGSKWGFSSYDTREEALKAQGYTSKAAHDLARSPHPPSHSTISHHSGGGGGGGFRGGNTTGGIDHASSSDYGADGDDHSGVSSRSSHGGHSGGGGSSSSHGSSSTGSSGGSHGATRGTPGGSTGRIGRYDGGIVDAVLASNPYDDGLVPMALGEGVISRAGMAWLDDINAGRVPDAMQGVSIDYDALARALARALQASQSSSMDGDVGRALFTIAKHCQKSAKILDRWDATGQPEVRDAGY